MELDLQSLFGLHVHSCNHWLRPRNHPPPLYPPTLGHMRGRYWSAKIDDIHLFGTPWSHGMVKIGEHIVKTCVLLTLNLVCMAKKTLYVVCRNAPLIFC
jgi:hypothetical protein